MPRPRSAHPRQDLWDAAAAWRVLTAKLSENTLSQVKHTRSMKYQHAPRELSLRDELKSPVKDSLGGGAALPVEGAPESMSAVELQSTYKSSPVTIAPVIKAFIKKMGAAAATTRNRPTIHRESQGDYSQVELAGTRQDGGAAQRELPPRRPVRAGRAPVRRARSRRA